MNKKNKPHTSPVKGTHDSSQKPRTPQYDRLRTTLAKFLTEELEETEDFQSAMEIMRILVPLNEDKKETFHALGFNNKFLSEGRGQESYLASDDAPFYMVTFATDLYLDFVDFFVEIIEGFEDQVNSIFDDEENWDPQQRFLKDDTRKVLVEYLNYCSSVKKHLIEVKESNKDTTLIRVRRDSIHDYAHLLLSLVAIYQRLLEDAIWVHDDDDQFEDDDDEGDEGGNENGDVPYFPFFPQDSKYKN